MITEELIYQIKQRISLQLTSDQDLALHTFADFLFCHEEKNCVMILCGSAGTGKTTIASGIVRTMVDMKQKVMLLAPTGRAAKVFSLNSGQPAFTIHRKIYRQKTFDGDGGCFSLNDNLFSDTLFLVDEASMIGNDLMQGSSFGSGRLLDDLIQYVYSGRNCRLILIGDNAQLPPIGEDESPALTPMVLESYGLHVFNAKLDEVLRQSSQSGILYNATVIRNMITHDSVTQLPIIRFNAFADICYVRGDELIDTLSTSYMEVGIDETTVVTRSNKRANIYNNGIRSMVLDREESLSSGDMLMVVKNNYYWTEFVKSDISFIANGDRAIVKRIRNVRDLYGFHFADALLCFPDYDNYEMQTIVMLDTLTSDAPSLTREQNEMLFDAVMEDYSEILRKPDRIQKIKQNGYFNAIQIKYAYAVTCHKAQGGQWAHVYIDQGYMTKEMLTPDYIHWLYTAFTRASEKLYLVNWSKEQTEGGFD